MAFSGKSLPFSTLRKMQDKRDTKNELQYTHKKIECIFFVPIIVYEINHIEVTNE